MRRLKVVFSKEAIADFADIYNHIGRTRHLLAGRIAFDEGLFDK
jgi:hypothetical protein